MSHSRARLLKSHEFSDIVFLVEGKPIYAHKAVRSSAWGAGFQAVGVYGFGSQDRDIRILMASYVRD